MGKCRKPIRLQNGSGLYSRSPLSAGAPLSSLTNTHNCPRVTGPSSNTSIRLACMKLLRSSITPKYNFLKCFQLQMTYERYAAMASTPNVKSLCRTLLMLKYACSGKSFVYHHMLRTSPTDHPVRLVIHVVNRRMTSHVTKLSLGNAS